MVGLRLFQATDCFGVCRGDCDRVTNPSPSILHAKTHPCRMPGRRKSESPGRTEAAEARRMLESLGTETRSRRVAEVALAKRKEEVERLKAEVVALKVKRERKISLPSASLA